MVISLHKLLPLIALGAIANHSKDAIGKRLAALKLSPNQFVVERSMKNILYSIQLRTVGETTVTFGTDTAAYIRTVAASSAGDPAKDPWGGVYKLFQRGNSIVMISAGPDRRFSTQDDIMQRIDLMNY